MYKLACAGRWCGRGEVALGNPGAVVPCRRHHGRRSRAKVFVRYSKELLERLILVPWGVYVDDTQSDTDLRRNLTVQICPRTGQPCQGRETADDPRQDLSSPCMRFPRSTIHTYNPAFHTTANSKKMCCSTTANRKRGLKKKTPTRFVRRFRKRVLQKKKKRRAKNVARQKSRVSLHPTSLAAAVAQNGYVDPTKRCTRATAQQLINALDCVQVWMCYHTI